MHSQEHRCPRCHVFFTSRGLLETHAQLPPEEMCQVVSERQFSFEDGVGFEQAWSLKEHMASETMTWQTLWNILFPEDPNYTIPPPSMYCPTLIPSMETDPLMLQVISPLLKTLRSNRALESTPRSGSSQYYRTYKILRPIYHRI